MNQTSRSKQLNWKDYWEIAKRRRWTLLGPFFVCCLLGVVVAYLWPTRYKSDATVLVVQQKLSDKYVIPNVVSNADSRLQGLTEEILSRTRLQQIIQRFGLYAQDRSRLSLDELVERMRRSDIEIAPVKSADRPEDLTAFHITYLATSPWIAQQVVNELTSLFIEENFRARTQQAAGTTSFFENELSRARESLAEKEKRLSDYKLQYLGELPEQQESNLEILRNLESQLAAISSSLDRSQQEKTYLESMKAEYVAVNSAAGIGDGKSGSVNPDMKLKELRAKLADLEAELTPQHPDVIQTKADIAKWEGIKKKMSSDAARASHEGDDDKSFFEAFSTQPNLIDIESRLKAVKADIANRSKEMAIVQGRMRASESRLNLTPVREQELAAVTREVQSAKDNYDSLLRKKSDSQLATNLEEHQQGEQFRVIDAPTLPQKPSQPDRPFIILAAWALGLFCGVIAAMMKESSDTVVRGEQALLSTGPLPLRASIPMVRSSREESHERRRLRLEALAVGALLLFAVVSVVYTYLVG